MALSPRGMEAGTPLAMTTIPTARNVYCRIDLDQHETILLKTWLSRALGTYTNFTTTDQIRSFLKRIDDEIVKSTLDENPPAR